VSTPEHQIQTLMVQKILDHNHRMYAALLLIRSAALENMATDKSARYITQTIDDVMADNGS